MSEIATRVLARDVASGARVIRELVVRFEPRFDGVDGTQAVRS